MKRLNISQLISGVLIVIGCLLLIISTGKSAASKLLGHMALITNSIAAADQAVRLAPSDPQSHQARALVLRNLNRANEAAAEMEIAVSLRPRDDYLWLELGNMRDVAGYPEAALAAFDRAVTFAPYYGHTHWQRGNLLVRMGRYEEGFASLRTAAAANKEFLPALTDLAWSMSQGNVDVARQILQIRDDDTRLAFVRLLARRGVGAAALSEYQQLTGPVDAQVKDELIRWLLMEKAFAEAYEVWKQGKPSDKVVNGSFEDDLVLDHFGFGWQAPNRPGVAFALDVSQPHDGARSLRITFDGYKDHSILSQWLVVNPGQRYRLTCVVRSRDVVSGGLPVITITDARSGETLGSSEMFEASPNTWTTAAVDFATTGGSNAVSLNLQRNACATSPCPIFGEVWLDSFVLAPIENKR